MSKAINKVKYTGECSDAQVAWGNCADPRKVLQAGSVYEVERKEVHGWHTKVFLVGISGGFNSVIFEDQQ